jgi:hypothetical protein
MKIRKNNTTTKGNNLEKGNADDCKDNAEAQIPEKKISHRQTERELVPVHGV